MTVYTLTRAAGETTWDGECVSDDGQPRREWSLSSDEQMLDFVRGSACDPGRCEIRVLCDQDAKAVKVRAA